MYVMNKKLMKKMQVQYKKSFNMNIDGYQRRGRSKKTWTDCVKHNRNTKKVKSKIASDEWEKKTFRRLYISGSNESYK